MNAALRFTALAALAFSTFACSSSGIPGSRQGLYEGSTFGTREQVGSSRSRSDSGSFPSKIILSEDNGTPYVTLRYLVYDCALKFERKDDGYEAVLPALCSANLGACEAGARFDRAVLRIEGDEARLEGRGTYAGCGDGGNFEGSFVGTRIDD